MLFTPVLCGLIALNLCSEMLPDARGAVILKQVREFVSNHTVGNENGNFNQLR